MPIRRDGQDHFIDKDLYQGADLIWQRPRRGTPINYWWHWYRSAVGNVDAISISIAVKNNLVDPIKVYIAYVSPSNALTIVSALLTEAAQNMIWTVETTVNYVQACSLSFDGSFTTDGRIVEFISDETPWLFYVTTTGELLGGLLGSVSYENVSGTVTAIDVVRGVSSRYGDNDQGMVLFYVSSGTLYCKQLIDDVWGDQQTINLAPANVVSVRAERTFDWRIVLQVTDSTGALYEIFTKMSASGWVGVDHISAACSMSLAVHEIGYLESKSQDEHISVMSALALSVLYALSPVMQSAENIAWTDETLELTDDYGYKVRLAWDERVFSYVDNVAAFSLMDESAAVFGCTAIEMISSKVLELTFQNFNNAVGMVTLEYTPGTMTGDVVAISSDSITFTPTGLVPFAVDPPIPVSVYNAIDWEADA